MRKIEFRGKTDNEESVFMYGYLRQFNDLDLAFIWDEKSHSHRVDPKTVGQYIGIKDMTGRDIYEGDILKTESDSKTRIEDGKRFPQYSSRTIEILFEGGNFKSRIIAQENSWWGDVPSEPETLKGRLITKHYKIIGNIHTPTNA